MCTAVCLIDFSVLMFYLRLDDHSLTLATYTHHRVEEANDQAPLFLQQALSPSLPLEQQLRQLRAGHPCFAQIQSMQVLVVGACTLVPLAEFDEEQCEQLYRFCVVGEEQPKSRLRVFYDILPSSNVALIFALDEAKCKAIESEFGEVYYVSAFTATLRHLSSKTDPLHLHRSYLYCRDGATDIAVFEGQRLQLFNSFPTLTAKDAAYYTFALLQSLGLSPNTTPIAIYGHSPLCEPTLQEVQRYAPHVGQLHLTAEHLRHPVAQLDGIPFDLATQIILDR